MGKISSPNVKWQVYSILGLNTLWINRGGWGAEPNGICDPGTVGTLPTWIQRSYGIYPRHWVYKQYLLGNKIGLVWYIMHHASCIMHHQHRHHRHRHHHHHHHHHQPFITFWLWRERTLKNMKISWDYSPQYMENKKCSKPPTRYVYIYIVVFTHLGSSQV